MGAGRSSREVGRAAVLQQSTHIGFLAQAADLLSGRLVIAELVAYNGTCVRDQGLDHILLEL